MRLAILCQPDGAAVVIRLGGIGRFADATADQILRMREVTAGPGIDLDLVRREMGRGQLVVDVDDAGVAHPAAPPHLVH